jgi:hypothetical protein
LHVTRDAWAKPGIGLWNTLRLMEAAAMDIEVDQSGAAPLIPPGRYQATPIYWETRLYLTAPKAYLWFGCRNRASTSARNCIDPIQ